MEMYRGKKRCDSGALSINRLRLREPQLHQASASGLGLLCSSIHSINILLPPGRASRRRVIVNKGQSEKYL